MAVGLQGDDRGVVQSSDDHLSNRLSRAGARAYELPSHVLGTNLGRSVASNLTTVINPTMTNEFVFAISKLKLDNDYADPSKVSLDARS